MTVALRSRPTPVVAAGFDDAIGTVIVPRRRPHRAPVGPLEELVLTRIDGRRTLSDIAALLNLSSREILAVVMRLEELRLADLGNVSGRYAIVDLADDEWGPNSDMPTAPGDL